MPMTVDMVVQQAIDAVRERGGGGELFKLRDLFPADVWNQIPVGIRLVAGKRFKEKMQSVDEASCQGANTTNHQRYLK